ncbi:dihydroneopterin aldolase [Helicobacter sp. MIT 05-5294]|uniref:dihydroneopterin aldolase n=1 Tax=Helicobacter sp. MIT 05-5294 TaxID=1548150 RepID=UPI000B2FB058|nr:dihydroneopterin aldolase [Helicobacter sp. MIT 05-5294]
MQEESSRALMGEYTICLEDFVLETIIGILPKERERAQKIKINAEFICQWNPKTHFENAESHFSFADSSNPPLKNHDNIESQNFLDYRDLREFIKDSFAREFGLLEEAQSYFYREIPLCFPQIKAFWIQITKLEIFEDCKISIKINYQK